MLIEVELKKQKEFFTNYKYPMDNDIKELMLATAYLTSKALSGFKFAIVGYGKILYFIDDTNVDSIISSLTTVNFNINYNVSDDKKKNEPYGYFESRTVELNINSYITFLIDSKDFNSCGCIYKEDGDYIMDSVPPNIEFIHKYIVS
jgi:hypothetical protein